MIHLMFPVSGAGLWLGKGERIKVDLSGKLTNLEGRTVSLNDLRGEVVFLNFWATWCGPCLAEMPSIAKLHEEFSQDGLEIVAITNEDREPVNRFLDEYPYPFKVWLDPEDQLAGRLNIWSIPMTLILDKNGKLVHFHQGARLWDAPDVRENLKLVLKE
jgi:thiol-disulfide isomerase/thioredoxin